MLQQKKQRKNTQRKLKKRKPPHRQFRKAEEKVRGKGSWDWMKKGYLKKKTESTIVVAQNQAPCTRNMKNVVYGENVQSICRACGVVDKTVTYIVSECSKLVQKEYKQV